jgi:hypothetical protein
MKIIFHIGVQKTATTLLQKKIFPYIEGCVFLNRKDCHDFKKYILYSDDFEFDPKIAFNFILKTLQKKENSKNNDTILISDEEYYGNPYLGALDRKRNLDRILQTFHDGAYFLIFLRNQENLLFSLYNQYIKTGGTANFHQFLSFRKYPLLIQNSYFKYNDYLVYLINQCSKDKVKVILFEEFNKNKPAVINEIGYFINDKKIEVNSSLDEKINTSLFIGNLGVMRFLNKFTKSPKEPFLLFNFIFHKTFKRVLTRINLNIPNSLKKCNNLDEFMGDIKKSNKELINNFSDLKITENKYPLH